MGNFELFGTDFELLGTKFSVTFSFFNKTISYLLIFTDFQAQKKLKSIKTAQENKVNSEEVVRLAHLISRSYSVAAPFTWVQGDPSRPFPTEADFAVSHLMNSRNYSVEF